MKLPALLAALSLSAMAAEDAGVPAGASAAASEGAHPEAAWEAVPLVEIGPTGRWTELALDRRPLWARLRTTKGEIVVRLFSERAPRTVANFVGLATGEREWRDPFTTWETKRPLYDGTAIHRVVPGFIFQGGDPTGTGHGNPGYRFADERTGIDFDRPGIVGMANHGPDTNGSQFFVTVTPRERPPRHLDGQYVAFGEVVKGLDVARAIAASEADGRGRPKGAQVLLLDVKISARAPPGSRQPSIEPRIKR